VPDAPSIRTGFTTLRELSHDEPERASPCREVTRRVIVASEDCPNAPQLGSAHARTFTEWWARRRCRAEYAL
jgi:hypothetical protein